MDLIKRNKNEIQSSLILKECDSYQRAQVYTNFSSKFDGSERRLKIDSFHSFTVFYIFMKIRFRNKVEKYYKKSFNS
jgi:hypothetical protein